MVGSSRCGFLLAGPAAERLLPGGWWRRPGDNGHQPGEGACGWHDNRDGARFQPGGRALHGLHVDLTVPAGWSRTTTSPPVPTVAPGGGADVSFRVTAPSSAGAGTYVLTARASWDGGTLGRTLVRAVTVDAS
jgi:hypothetical protein